MSRSTILWLVLLLTAFTGQSQIEQGERLEFELKDNEEKYKAVGMGVNGLLLYRQLAGDKDDRLDMVSIDTTLHVNWNRFIAVSKSLNLVRVQKYNELVFFLFKDRLLIGGNFEIATVNIRTGEFGRHTVRNVIPFQPIEFAITDKAAMIGGYFNYRPLIVYYSFTDLRSRILPGFFNEPGELDQLKTYDDGSVDVIVSARNLEKKRCLWIRNYNAEGELVKTTIIQPEKGKNLIFGHSVKLENGSQVVAGVYGRFSNADNSRGIFVAGISPQGEYAIDYYNFAHLQNFFSYMRVKKQKRLKRRIERKTIRGKKIKFNYRFILHDIIPYKNQYIMTGEAFYPHYIYPSTAFRSSYTRVYTGNFLSYPSQRTDVIFDGYQYTHAVVIGFDKDGKLKWDNSFEINDVRTMELEKFVEVKPEQDRILMMYLFSNTLRTKIIHDSEVLEGKSQDAMKTRFSDKEIKQKTAEGEQLDYWYGDYFYAFGIQKIQLKSGPSKRILFINKISYK